MKITMFISQLFFFTLITITLHALLKANVVQDGTSQSDCRIIDLSEDLLPAENFNNNNGSKYLLNITKHIYHQVLSYVVLEDGLKIADYYNLEQGINEAYLHHVFSVTKSWTSLLIGILVSMGNLSLHETLSDIWPDDMTNVWVNVHDASYRKNITVKELLTMTSGCHGPREAYEHFFSSMKDGSFGGGNLTSALNYQDCSNPSSKKEFNYVEDNILSYIILQRSGLTTQDFAAKYLMPFLGMLDDSWKWQRNLDGIAYASAGLTTTTMNLAKFGQLYLQNGYASGSKQVVPQSWIEQSTTSQVKILPGHPFRMYITDNDDVSVDYGYRFWIIGSDTRIRYCANGAFGHYICVWPKMGRVLVVNVARTKTLFEWLGWDFAEMVGNLQFN